MAKGYIRMHQLDKRKVEYLLTPKGFSEKYQKSVKYTLKTINSIGLIRVKLQTVIGSLYDRGERKFYVLGDSDLAILAEMVLKTFVGIQHERIKLIPPDGLTGVILICREQTVPISKGQCFVDMIQELAKDDEFASMFNKEGKA
jgi:hypothetical protein